MNKFLKTYLPKRFVLKRLMTRLDALFAEKKNELLDCLENNRPYVIHNLDESISELKNIDFLKDLDSMLNSWPNDVSVHLPDKRDEISSIDVAPKEAKALFDNGMAILFNDVNTISETLRTWHQDLVAEMGFSAMTYARSLVYVTPKDGGTATHFDQNYNLVLQLSGTKKWWIADNTTVQNPLTRHTLGSETCPELQSYTYEEFPTEMPGDAKEYELKAGSLLFVPRGAWHKTHASEEAMALNFTFSAPTYLDILSAALRGRLAQSPMWRETVLGLNSEQGAHLCAHKLDMLLAELKEDVKTWEAFGVLGATEAQQ